MIQMQKFIYFICLLILCQVSFAQTSDYPYQLKLKNDLIISGISGLSLFSESLIGSQVHNETESYFNSLNANSINSIDRNTINNWNPKAELTRENLGTVGLWGIGLGGTTILSVVEGLRPNGRGRATSNALTNTVMIFEGGLFVLCLSDMSKALVKRPRPFAYNPNLSYQTKTESEDYKESFFSGNTAITAYGTFYFAKVINDIYPNSKWKYAAWGCAGIYTATAGYLAVKSGNHFPTDIFVGSLVGAGTAILIPHLHKIRINKNGMSLNVSPSAGGIYASLKF